MISRIDLEKLNSGDPGVRQTLKKMRTIILEGYKNPYMVKFTRELLKRNNAITDYERINTIFNFVSNKIRYQTDPKGVELLHTPKSILKRGFGDCDEKTILSMVMYNIAGIPARMVIVALKKLTDQFSHIYTQVMINNKWIGADSTLKNTQLGWEAPSPKRKAFLEIKKRIKL